MEDSTKSPIYKVLERKNPAKAIRIERSQEEWKKLLKDAKRKETFWKIGIVPGTPGGSVEDPDLLIEDKD